MFNRKHHCRLCGNVFCHQCSTGRGTIPSFIQTRSEFLDVRLCDNCLFTCNETNKSEPLVRVFALLPIDMKDIANLGINKRWYHATKTLVDVYTKIPYKMPYERFSRLEIQLLRTHKQKISGHSCWDKQIVRGLQEIPYKTFNTHCKDLKCTPACCKTNKIHILEILNTFPSTQILRNQTLTAWIATFLNKMTIAEHVKYMPHWLQRSMTPSAQEFIKKYIIPQCLNIHTAYAFYYECALYDNPVYKGLADFMLGKFPQHRKDLIYTDNLVQYIEELVDGSRFSVKLPAKLPYNPDVICTAIYDPQQIQSASKPSTLVLKTNVGQKIILVKKDDMRKDRLVMLFADFIQQICETKCVNYSVFATKRGGWVEMLPNAKTLYELKYSLSCHIYNKFPDTPVRAVRKRFIRSAVGACVLSYLLGVGDRHLQNMVISNGELAHIDFSYLLGHDPKLTMDIRITPPMILMMGGDNSADYAQFVTKITEAFHKMRQHTGLWYALMTYLSSSFSLLEIQNHVKRKLMPSLKEAEATMRIVEIVKHNSNTWKHSLSDVTHQIFQLDF
jgi:hypothetical protein